MLLPDDDSIHEAAMLWKTTLLVMLLLVVGWVVTMVVLRLLAKRPDALGIHDGRLAACPNAPNCVCSQAGDALHAIEPVRFEGSPEEAWRRLRDVLARWPRTHIVGESDGYLRAECASFLFRFIDDVEFLLDRDARVIHFRSASRAGRSDLGVNRKRMEGIRLAFTAR
jgi:uncharacterized protein (DUF1499 family)